MTSDQSHHFFQSLLMIGHYTSVIQFTYRRHSMSLSDKPVRHFTKTMLKVKFKLNVNEIVEEIAVRGNIDTTLSETLNIQQQDLRKGELTHI